MSNFVHYLSYAAGIRERVVREEKRPEGTKMRDKNRAYWWDHFSKEVSDDGFLLGRAVAVELVKVVEELASRGVFGEDAEERERSQQKGAELAAFVYLDILGL